jgi:hypothetical protein
LSQRVGAALLVLLAPASVSAQTSPSVTTVAVGTNVNMAGGPASFTPPSTLIGDPFLQRQNEPSLALSSRNPCHILAGANDYRLVDLEEAVGETGDAWLGLFKSFDCGATWTSTLLPGHRLDASPEGLASPIKGLQAGADATVRAGVSGMFYFTGLALNRGEGEASKVFVSRFIDLNNKDGGDPIRYLDTKELDLGTSGQFLDKPWVATDIPRGTATCTVAGQQIPAGPVYVTYSTFLGSGNNVRTRINFRRSLDCGATWDNVLKLSERFARNQGTAMAVDPGTGYIYIAWREFGSAGDTTTTNAILIARSTDGGRSFTKAQRLSPGGYALQPFDQASSPLTFRTNAYPTIAIVPAEAEGRAAGQPGRVYVAWAGRGFGVARPTDARVLVSSSLDGVAWTAPRPADNYPGAGHQVMPALTFAGGRLALAYYDLRDDASNGFDDLVIEYGQAAYDRCLAQYGSSGFAAVYACIVSAPEGLPSRHTLDMRAALADASCLASGACDFTSYSVLPEDGGGSRVSRYIEGRGTPEGPKVQLQYNRPNLPLFSRGRFPFIGDYIDVAGEHFVFTAQGWRWNTGLTPNRPAPVFHVSWADNRNVGTPRLRDANFSPDWEAYTPPVLGPNSVICVPGQVGIRNQDVFTATLRPGLVVSAPANSKRLAGLQRSFVVVARNTTDFEREYVMEVAPPAGVIASFDQFRGFGALTSGGTPTVPLTRLTVRIPRRSSASRTVFVGLVDPSTPLDALVPVEVSEVIPGTPTETGVVDNVYLNPDFENPDFENPDFENAELHNPDFENPDFENPDFENPDFENFTLGATSSIRNPDFENPDFENPDFENPDFENPDFENPDFENGSFQVADTTWPVRNNGNTTSGYKTNVYVNEPPAGVRYQLMVRRIFESPAAVCAVPGSTEAPSTAQSVALVNVVNPNVQVNPFDRSFNDPSRDNVTFHLAPNERALVTLRAYCAEGDTACSRSLMASLQNRVALGVVAQGANCATCTGAGCSNTDFVTGPTECIVENGPPRDIYDPVAPQVTLLNPTLTTPEVVLVRQDNDNDGSEAVSFEVTATDNVGIAQVACLADGVGIELVGSASGTYTFTGTFPVGLTGVTCRASDLRLPLPNVGSTSFIVDVRDVTPPTFETTGDPGSPFTPSNPAEATGPNGAQVFYTNPTAVDSNGGSVTVVCASPTGLVSGSTFPIGVTDINCVATDGAGIATPPTNLFDITVADHTAPVVTVTGPTAVTLEAGGSYTDAGATATDAVSGAVNVTTSGAVNPLVPGTYVITYTATDGAGNTATATRTVTVRDTVAPVFGQAPNLTAEAASAAGAVVTYTTPTASDTVGVTSVSCVPASGSLFALGTTTVTCTAQDAALNTAVMTFTVTVEDTTPPVFTSAPANLTVEASTAAGASVSYAPEATDTVSLPVTVTCTPPSGTTFPIGTTSVTCVARDAALRTATATFTVTVRDTTAPIVVETATPNTLLWSPNRTMTPVAISGSITEIRLRTATFEVWDEYVRDRPIQTGTLTVGANGAYSFVVTLEAWREGTDSNGRVYTIRIRAEDLSGNVGTGQAIVLVPHNQ